MPYSYMHYIPAMIHVHCTSLAILGTLRYSGRGRGGRQPEVKCSILGTN